MTLQDIVKILNLNPLWKEASEDEKITAINQVLNDLEIDKLLNGTDALKYKFQVQKFKNLTYKQLNETLELKLTEEEILALFQYTLIEISNDSPFEVTFQGSIVTDNVSRPAKLNYKAVWNIPEITNIDPVTVRLGYKSIAKKVVQKPTEIIMGINYLSTYNKNLVTTTEKVFSIGYKSTYKKQNLSESIVSGLGYSATYSIL